MSVLRKQLIASSGFLTTGSFSLKEVLRSMGTPDNLKNDSIKL
jgi:hypothetical protein